MPCGRGCCPDFKTHIRSVNLAAAATPSRRPRSVEIEATEKRWHKDHDAFRRLVREGHDPGRLEGAAEIEAKATTKYEIEKGRLVPEPVKKALEVV